MKKGRIKKMIGTIGLSAMMAAAMLLSGCGSTPKAEEETSGKAVEETSGKGAEETQAKTVDKKVGCILGVGGLGDQSFNDLIYEGLEKAKSELGVDFDYAEPTQVSDFEVMMRDMASGGDYEVIICVGFDATDALSKVAPEFTDQQFAFIDGSLEAENVVNYAAKEEEGSFLAGVLAGLMKNNPAEYKVEDNDAIGFIAALETPILLKWNAGYQAGAQYINPDIVCEADFIAGDNPFGDTTTAKEIAISQKNKGADIIFHAAGGSGLGVFDAAGEYDFYAIGCNSNQNGQDSDHIVASILKRVDTAAYDIAKAACIDDNLAVGTTVALGLSDNGMDITFDNSNVSVRDEDKEIIEKVKQKIVAGEIKVPSTMEDAKSFAGSNTYSEAE